MNLKVEILRLAAILLEELSGQDSHVSGGRGYGVGQLRFKSRPVNQMLGSSGYEEDPESDKEDEDIKPVEVSRAFKNDVP